MANYLVIAASSGIGQAVVTGLLTKGHHVFQTSRSQDKINPDALLDATDFDAVDQVFVAAQSKLGKLDGVVNCSGALLLKPAHMTSKEQYQTVIDASLTTSFAVA
jgi:NAD(P)-dependent dehydrogenase (short-subunit alcohol dehydrogenase family)